MCLNQKTNTIIHLSGIIFLFISLSGYSIHDKGNILRNGSTDSNFFTSSSKEYYYNNQYNLSLKNYQKEFEINPADSISIYKNLAFYYTKLNNPELACKYIEEHIKSSLDITFAGHSYFKQISDSEVYQSLLDKYDKKIRSWSIFCFCTGFLGVFIAVMLNLRKRADRTANLLMSIFVFQHSFFIIHISLLLSNYEYYLPETLYMSTPFSFLYGPLIYMYFKRVTIKYEFKYIDLLHLVPTFGLVLLLLPIYILPTEEKLRMVIHNERPYIALISISKLISLLIYGGLVMRMYIKSIIKNKYIPNIVYAWQRNIVIFCSIYIVSYGIYSILIIQYIFSGFLFYLQIVAMALLVLYVSYTAFVQPGIFGSFIVIKDNIQPKFDKYKKSGLTKSLSLELKEKLVYLLDKEKIYKQNNITLQKLAELLGTTRHNASQIINEHFNLNFFELINKYRIEEAKELLKGEKYKNFNIIDIAYEVGFNNKVTFNKSFKKYNKLTPSEFIKSFEEKQLVSQ